MSTNDGAVDSYDHAISLIDTTTPQQNNSRKPSPGPPSNKLDRQSTKTSVKIHLIRNRYAKYQQDRYSNYGSIASENEQSQSVDTDAQDFAQRGGRKKLKSRPKHEESPSEIDVLYENQRGAFFCGIPLYSHSSLLNFDPSPWVTKEYKTSPVNITNAQVPDPSWQWAWKTWYVDMSYDVDEEGWQYSFAFGSRFVWHGSHPWFHSFVRRRRWLRKRVQINKAIGQGKDGSMSAAHQLTGDYFTIHPKRDNSPSNGFDGTRSNRPDSYVSERSRTDEEQMPDDLKDIPSLLKALQLATIDREKIEAVKQFVSEGGEELTYLRDNIPTIMSLLVFQNSKRQLLSYLKKTANDAQKHRKEHEAKQDPESESEERRINNLLAAVDVADQQIGGLEYWSDRKHVLQTADNESTTVKSIATIFDQPAPKPKAGVEPAANIKGISNDAEVGIDPTHKMIRQAHISKGKSRDTETNQIENEEPRNTEPVPMGTDDILVPDEHD